MDAITGFFIALVLAASYFVGWIMTFNFLHQKDESSPIAEKIVVAMFWPIIFSIRAAAIIGKWWRDHHKELTNT